MQQFCSSYIFLHLHSWIMLGKFIFDTLGTTFLFPIFSRIGQLAHLLFLTSFLSQFYLQVIHALQPFSLLFLLKLFPLLQLVLPGRAVPPILSLFLHQLFCIFFTLFDYLVFLYLFFIHFTFQYTRFVYRFTCYLSSWDNSLVFPNLQFFKMILHFSL